MKLSIRFLIAVSLLITSGCQTAIDPPRKLTAEGLEVRRVVLTSPATDWIVVESLTHLAREEYGEPMQTGWVWLDDMPKSDWRAVEITAKPRTQALIVSALINYRGHAPNHSLQLTSDAR